MLTCKQEIGLRISDFSMDGILNINKPPGMTSYAVVAAVKRLSHERHVGHAGTLDPAATGVLPVCLGKATRLSEFVMESPKTYRGEVELGITTDTGDAPGTIVRRADASSIDREALVSTLGVFRGRIQQTPPMYSALKHHGSPLYRLARAGITVERPTRPVQIYALELLSWQPPVAEIEVTCSRGTYMRSLAQDIGEALGCGGHLRSLTRTRCGPFDLEDSISLEELEAATAEGRLFEILHPLDTVLLRWPALIAGAQMADDIRHGRPVSAVIEERDSGSVSLPKAGDHCRAYTLDGCFLGVLRFNAEREEWQPEKVFV